MAERHVTELIGEVFRRGGFVRAVQRAKAVAAWREVAGRDLARFATAVALQQGTLIVEVGDNETAMHLGLQRQRLIEAYRRHLGENLVRDLRFRVGRPPATEPEPEAPPAFEADPTDLAGLSQGLVDLPEPLSAPAAALSRSLAVMRARQRAAGWKPCPVCGRLSAPGPGEEPRACQTCRRAATLPKVVRAGQVLLTAPADPTPALTEDERLVAVALAQERARRAVDELLPQVVADAGLRPVLAQLLRCAVALQRGVGLDEVPDLEQIDPSEAGLDPRAWRVLGHRPP